MLTTRVLSTEATKFGTSFGKEKYQSAVLQIIQYIKKIKSLSAIVGVAGKKSRLAFNFHILNTLDYEYESNALDQENK